MDCEADFTREHLSRQVANYQDRFPDRVRDSWKLFAESAADHQFDNPLAGKVLGRTTAHQLAVAENTEVVGHCLNFLEKMTDINNCCTALPQPSHQTKQPPGIFLRQ